MRYNSRMVPIVLFFQYSAHKSWRDKLAGVYRYANHVGWQVQVIDASSSADEIRDAVSHWQPIGCIMNRTMPAGSNPKRIFHGIPTVFLDEKPWSSKGSFPCVTHDSAQTAKVAAAEFLRSDIRHFAYIPWSRPIFWSDEREHAFAAAIRKAKRVYVGRIDDQALGKLPKPCGIFCANDIVAQRAMANAHLLGLRIPDDLAFIGVDNDEFICEHTRPPLTSILPDFERAGFMVAESLDRIIRGERTPNRVYGPVSIVRRASSRRLVRNDPRVSVALVCIREHAFDPGFKADAVAQAMGCSRRLADLRFRESVGHSIRDEIHALRLERAFSLLRNPSQAISPIANLCGYASEPFLKRLFKRKTGLSMRDWRKAHLTSTIRSST